MPTLYRIFGYLLLITSIYSAQKKREPTAYWFFRASTPTVSKYAESPR